VHLLASALHLLTGDKKEVSIELTPEEPIRAKKRRMDVRTAGRRISGGGFSGKDYRRGGGRDRHGGRDYDRGRYSDRGYDRDRQGSRSKRDYDGEKSPKRNGGYINPF